MTYHSKCLSPSVFWTTSAEEAAPPPSTFGGSIKRPITPQLKEQVFLLPGHLEMSFRAEDLPIVSAAVSASPLPPAEYLMLKWLHDESNTALTGAELDPISDVKAK